MPELITTPLYNLSTLAYYWQFQGNSNTTKGSNNGTDTSITYNTTFGTYGQGAGFNGSSSRIILTTSLTIGTNPWSVGATIKTSSATEQCIYTNGSNTTNQAFEFGINGSGQVYLELYGSTVATGLTVVNDGLPHIIVAVYNGSTCQIYANGAPTNSAFAMSPNIQSGARLHIGNTSDGGVPRWFNGGIDDLFLFNNKALTAGEVAQLTHGGGGGLLGAL